MFGVCGSAGCGTLTTAGVSSGQPDRVLYERAMSALEEERLDVANLTLQTLVNTYPESEYAETARVALTDPRIANCGEDRHSFTECGVVPDEYPLE